MPAQQEFLFIGNIPNNIPETTPATPATPATHAISAISATPATAPVSEETIIDEIRATWRIPFLRQKVRVTLRGCPVDEMNGLLEIADPAPDYPFDAAKPLHLRIDSIRFTHKQILACVLL
jgi:hypothetical protein